MRCPSCAATVDGEETTCPACGVSVASADGADAASEAAADAASEAVAVTTGDDGAGDEGDEGVTAQAPGDGEDESVGNGEPDGGEVEASAGEAVDDDAGPALAAGKSSRAPEILHFRVAGFFERALAGLVDALIILPLFAVLAWVGSLVTGVEIPQARELSFDLVVGLLIESNGPMVFWGVLLVMVLLLYCFIFLAARGQTPGKRLVGVRVVTWYGEPPTLARALVRTLGYLASASLLWLGFIWIGFDREKRGLHDWIAGTYVVRT